MHKRRKSQLGYFLVTMFHDELATLLDDMSCVPEPGEAVDPIRARYDLLCDMRTANLAMKLRDVRLQDLLTIWLNQQRWLEWLSSQADDLAEGDQILADVREADQRMADAIVRADRKRTVRR